MYSTSDNFTKEERVKTSHFTRDKDKMAEMKEE
jgi:hypothetical protein